jgi:hypothetical protein
MAIKVKTLDDVSGAVFCRAQLNYVARHVTDGDQIAPTAVTIYDGRRASLPGWELCGFELLAHESAVNDWEDESEIESVHYDEIAALARTLSGCDHALVATHINRNPEQAQRHADLAPIAFVHSDFAASYGALLRSRYSEPGPEARKALERAGVTADFVSTARRLLVLQFWRNTGPAKMDLPLAFCDGRSVSADDLKAIAVTNYAGGGFDFEALSVLAPDDPSRHRWYAFPEMHRGEVVAFRTYDSDRVKHAQPYWTPHSAFADPEVPPGNPSRRSIELRAICLFP